MPRELIDITKKSMMTGRMNRLIIAADPNDLDRWRAGALIQDALPYLKPYEREFLISGMSRLEQKQFFDWDDADG